MPVTSQKYEFILLILENVPDLTMSGRPRHYGPAPADRVIPDQLRNLLYEFKYMTIWQLKKKSTNGNL